MVLRLYNAQRPGKKTDAAYPTLPNRPHHPKTDHQGANIPPTANP